MYVMLEQLWYTSSTPRTLMCSQFQGMMKSLQNRNINEHLKVKYLLEYQGNVVQIASTWICSCCGGLSSMSYKVWMETDILVLHCVDFHTQYVQFVLLNDMDEGYAIHPTKGCKRVLRVDYGGIWYIVDWFLLKCQLFLVWKLERSSQKFTSRNQTILAWVNWLMLLMNWSTSSNVVTLSHALGPQGVICHLSFNKELVGGWGGYFPLLIWTTMEIQIFYFYFYNPCFFITNLYIRDTRKVIFNFKVLIFTFVNCSSNGPSYPWQSWRKAWKWELKDVETM